MSFSVRHWSSASRPEDHRLPAADLTVRSRQRSRSPVAVLRITVRITHAPSRAKFIGNLFVVGGH